MCKDRAQRVHAKRRIEERFGLTLNRQTYFHLVKRIQTGRATFIGRQTNRVKLYEIEYQGVVMRVVYDNIRHNIVTFLPQKGGTC